MIVRAGVESVQPIIDAVARCQDDRGQLRRGRLHRQALQPPRARGAPARGTAPCRQSARHDLLPGRCHLRYGHAGGGGFRQVARAHAPRGGAARGADSRPRTGDHQGPSRGPALRARRRGQRQRARGGGVAAAAQTRGGAYLAADRDQMGDRLSPDRRSSRRRFGLSRPHSLRLRLLGAMVAVFALGLGAAILSYRTEVHQITSDLRTRTLENQARELLEAVQVGRKGSLEVVPPVDWQQAYRGPGQQFVFTVFDATRRPVAWSANLSSPLPYIPVDSRDRLGPVELIGAGAARRAIVAARGPQGTTVLVGRGDRDRDELVDSLFEEGSEQL